MGPGPGELTTQRAPTCSGRTRARRSSDSRQATQVVTSGIARRRPGAIGSPGPVVAGAEAVERVREPIGPLDQPAAGDGFAQELAGPLSGRRILAGKAPGVMPGAGCRCLKGEDIMNGHRGWTGAVLVAAIVIAVGGCATVGSGSIATERVLSAAGFQMKLADTPETLATLHSLPPRTLVPQPRDGQMRYVYADTRCGCLYMGTESQYQEYQRLELEKQLADERLGAAKEYRNAVTTWGGAWGPWPWF